jgi:DNA helicase HerA-like ATPase
MFWKATFQLSLRNLPHRRSTGTHGKAATSALERTGRTEAGNGLLFRPRPRLARRSVPEVLIAADELPLFLPGPECPAPGDPDRLPRFGELLPIGRTAAGTVVGPVVEPEQGRHLAVLGETGMGKSSLLVALARRAARTSGVILLDPLGETARSLEEELGPEERRRSICISPGVRPRRVNALEGIASGATDDRVRSERRLNDLVHSLRRVRSGRYTDSAYWGPRLEEMLTRAVRAAAAWPRGTLVDAHTLLATGSRLYRDIPAEAVGPVRELAERIRERPEDAEGARRLLYEIVRSPVLERMLCAPDPDLKTAELVEPGRIVILSGDASRVGESTARYLLSVYLALVWSEVLSRPGASKTFIVLDEAQWFSHESLAEMLRLGRRANLHVVLATQSIASLPETVTEAVWTNVSDFVAFRGSPEESRELARAVRGVSTEAILSLPRGHAVVLLGKGHTVRWLRTLRLPKRTPNAPEGRLDPRPGGALGATDRTVSGPPAGSATRGPGSVSTRPREADPGTATSANVIDLLRLRAKALPPGSSLRVSLEELRRAVDPGGAAVRAAGSILRRAGAIAATERSDAGSIWLIAPDRIPPPEPAGTSENPRVDSEEPQPS